MVSDAFQRSLNAVIVLGFSYRCPCPQSPAFLSLLGSASGHCAIWVIFTLVFFFVPNTLAIISAVKCARCVNSEQFFVSAWRFTQNLTDISDFMNCRQMIFLQNSKEYKGILTRAGRPLAKPFHVLSTPCMLGACGIFQLVVHFLRLWQEWLPIFLSGSTDPVYLSFFRLARSPLMGARCFCMLPVFCAAEVCTVMVGKLRADLELHINSYDGSTLDMQWFETRYVDLSAEFHWVSRVISNSLLMMILAILMNTVPMACAVWLNLALGNGPWRGFYTYDLIAYFVSFLFVIFQVTLVGYQCDKLADVAEASLGFLRSDLEAAKELLSVSKVVRSCPTGIFLLPNPDLIPYAKIRLTWHSLIGIFAPMVASIAVKQAKHMHSMMKDVQKARNIGEAYSLDETTTLGVLGMLLSLLFLVLLGLILAKKKRTGPEENLRDSLLNVDASGFLHQSSGIELSVVP